MLVNVIKGFIIGLCASLPIGPIAILVIQRSLGGGHKAGFLTGLGASLVDTVYAIIAVFAFAVAEKFFHENEVAVYIAGGLIIAAVGVAMAFKDPFRKMKEEKTSSYSFRDFFEAVALGVANPGAIFVMFALFAFFDVQLHTQYYKVAPLLLALSGATILYWLVFSWIFSHLRKSFKIGTLLMLSRVLGVLVTIVGLVLLAEGLIKMIFAGPVFFI